MGEIPASAGGRCLSLSIGTVLGVHSGLYGQRQCWHMDKGVWGRAVNENPSLDLECGAFKDQ